MFDVNTYEVSCVVMPREEIQNNLGNLMPQTSSPILPQTTQNLNSPFINRLGQVPNVDNLNSSSAGSLPSNLNRSYSEDASSSVKKIKLDDNFSKQQRKSIDHISVTSPVSNEQNSKVNTQPNNLNCPDSGERVSVPCNVSSSRHKKKSLNQIGRSDKVFSAFISPDKKQNDKRKLLMNPSSPKISPFNTELPPASNPVCHELKLNEDVQKITKHTLASKDAHDIGNTDAVNEFAEIQTPCQISSARLRKRVKSCKKGPKLTVKKTKGKTKKVKCLKKKKSCDSKVEDFIKNSEFVHPSLSEENEMNLGDELCKISESAIQNGDSDHHVETNNAEEFNHEAKNKRDKVKHTRKRKSCDLDGDDLGGNSEVVQSVLDNNSHEVVQNSLCGNNQLIHDDKLSKISENDIQEKTTFGNSIPPCEENISNEFEPVATIVKPASLPISSSNLVDVIQKNNSGKTVQNESASFDLKKADSGEIVDKESCLPENVRSNVPCVTDVPDTAIFDDVKDSDSGLNLMDVNELPEEEKLPKVTIDSLAAQSNKPIISDDIIDFSGIELSPFNPSTFAPRGLFGNESMIPDQLDSATNYSTTIHVFKTQDNPVSRNAESVDPDKKSESPPIDFEIGSNSPEQNLKSESNGLAESLQNDEVDSDHSLVIAESVEDTVIPDVGNVVEASVSLNKSPKKRGKKKRSKISQAKRGPKKIELNHDANVPLTIASALESLEDIKFSDKHFKQIQHTLVNALINPNNATNTKEIVYEIIKYLISQKAYPMMHYFNTNDPKHLLPDVERCLVAALMQIKRKKKFRLEPLLESTVTTAYELVLGKGTLSILALSSLCRVITEICKSLGNKKRPLVLCSELLKIQHKFAPFLIASIAGVWKELFTLDDLSDEEIIFQSSLVYGIKQRPPALNEQQWNFCKHVVSSHFTVPLPEQINEIASFLMESMEHKCTNALQPVMGKDAPNPEDAESTIQNDYFENEYLYITPLVVFTAVEGWEWAKEKLIEDRIIPLLVKYSEDDINEAAFTTFVRLYADICYFCPDDEDPHEIFQNFFNIASEQDGIEFVKNAAAKAQMKLLLYKQQLLPAYLTQWISEFLLNNEPEYAEGLFHRRLMSDHKDFLPTEVL